jgi:hypothetical protein
MNRFDNMSLCVYRFETVVSLMPKQEGECPG